MFVMGQKEGLLQTFRVWVQNQFHVEAEYRSLGLITSERFTRVSPVDSVKLKWGYPDASDWIMPVEYDQIHLGQIKIRNGSLLDSASLARIFHFVDLSLAPQLYREYLQLQETNMRTLSESSEVTASESTSFIELGADLSLSTTERCGTLSVDSGIQQLSSGLIVLHGDESFRFRTIAQSIRERYEHLVAFIDFKDVASEMRSSEDYKNLSHVCLYVSEEDLAIDQNVKSIQTYLKDVSHLDFDQRPLVIIGLKSVSHFRQLFPHVEDQRVQTIPIDRWPLKSSDLTKVLDLILD